MDTIPANTSTTSVITPGSTVFSTIDTLGDRDWFRMTLDSGFTYGITLEGTGSATELDRPEYFVRNAAGTALENAADANFDGFVGGNFSPTTSGTYYLSATGYNDGHTGDYQLSLGTDDYRNNTATTGTVSPGGTATGTIGVNGDRDWFAVTFQAGFSYNIAMEGTGATGELDRPEFFVRNAAGTSLFNASDADFNGFVEGRFAATTTGTYYIDATGYNDGTNGDYTLTVGTDDYTNDTSTTGTIAPGGTASGTIGSFGDRDWFEITLQSGFSYNILMDGTGANGDLARPEFFVRDAAGTVVQNRADADANGTTGGIFTATADGTYYIEATGFNDGVRGDYTLFVGTDEARSTTATQQTIDVDGSVSGTIGGNGDRDWYGVTLEAGFSYAITMDGTGTTTELSRPEFFVYNAAGTQVANFSDGNGDGTVSSLYTPTSDGTYYIAATGFNDGVSGDYTLTLGGDDARNSIDTLRDIGAGQAVSGEIGLNGDRDWFRTVLQAGEDYTFSLTGDGSAGELSTVELNLYDNAGTLIANYDSGSTATQTAAFTPGSTGTYYIEALGRNNSDSGTYILSLAGPRPLQTGTNQDDVLFGDTRGENFSGLAGDDVIVANAGNDILFGGDGNDVLLGGDGNDLLYGEGGNDNLFGGNGNDVFFASDGADAFDGGSGIDRVQYSNATAGIRADLIFPRGNEGQATGDLYTNIENLRGSAFADNIRGNAGDNVLEGLAGNDILIGRDGDDTIIGNAGNDIMFGGRGADVLNGGSGIDRVHYGDAGTVGVRVDLQFTQNNTFIAVGDTFIGIENLRGSIGNDNLRGDTGDNALEGLDGNDVLIGRAGDDSLFGNGDNDLLYGGAGADLLNGGLGTDTAHYGDTAATVRADLVNFGANTGIAAGDTYVSIENLTGGQGGDDLRGNDARNVINGGNGNDYLTGRGGNDVMIGGNGNDVLFGGAGADVLTGGAGADSFRFNTPTEGVDRITDFTAGVDTIRLNDAGFTSLSTGVLSADNFRNGNVALDADDYILFNGTSLLYDADGNGSGAAVRFARFDGGPALDADDFLIF